jgi:tyrosine-protein kinase Etk/Wzc
MTSFAEQSGTIERRPDPAAEAGVRSEPAGLVREISILDILLVLARRRRLIFWTTLVCALTALVVSLLIRPSFTAVTVILPPQQGGSVASGMMSELSSLGALGGLAGGSLGLKNAGDMYVALFKSDTVEDGLIHEFDLEREYHAKYLSVARRDLEAHAKVTADTKTSLITIKFEDHDPHRAAALANGYVDEYRHLSEHLAITEAAQRRLFFQQQLAGAKNNLADAEAALVKTEQTTGLVGLDAQTRALIESAATLRAQIAAKQVQIQGMQTYAAEDNAGLQQAQKELAELKSQLARLGGNTDLDSGNILVPKGQVPEATVEYARKLRDVKYYETIFNILAKQFEMAKLDEAREGALVQVVDPAAVPDYKSSPKRALWTLVAMVLGFFASCAYVLWKATLRFLHEDPETDGKLRALGEMLSLRRRRSEPAL